MAAEENGGIMRLGTKIKIKRWSAEKQRMEKRELVLMGKYKYFGLFVDKYGIRECFTWQQLRQIERGEA